MRAFLRVLFLGCRFYVVALVLRAALWVALKRLAYWKRERECHLKSFWDAGVCASGPEIWEDPFFLRQREIAHTIHTYERIVHDGRIALSEEVYRWDLVRS